MSENKAQPIFHNYDLYTSPGKVFILGEYAVLAGLPAIVAAIAPRFQVRVKRDEKTIGESSTAFHADSPVGRLIEWAAGRDPRSKMFSFDFEDPYLTGGFGASTAQFATVYWAFALALGWDRSWHKVWELYRELTQSAKGLPPSGADLVAQWQGGIALVDAPHSECLDLWPAFDWSSLLVFSASAQPGRKVATHRHLEELAKRGFPTQDSGQNSNLISELEQSLRNGIDALMKAREGQVRGVGPLLGQALNDYADVLQRAGFEASCTTEDRQALGRLPGVLGVKGTGALQSDGLIVLMDSGKGRGTPERQKVIETAVARNLSLISDGLTCQIGVSCQMQ